MRTMNADFNGDGEENVGRPQCKRRRIFISRTVKAAKRARLARKRSKRKTKHSFAPQSAKLTDWALSWRVRKLASSVLNVRSSIPAITAPQSTFHIRPDKQQSSSRAFGSFPPLGGCLFRPALIKGFKFCLKHETAASRKCHISYNRN